MATPIYKNIKSTFTEAPKAQKKGNYLFYTFNQNNSGGGFHDSENYGQYVIVAARSAKEANSLAEGLGLYFDGVDGGSDCDCCGDRWYRAHDGDGTETPEVYGKDPEALLAEGGFFRDKVVVHYPDGSKRVIERTDRKRRDV
jgi:hypothetical protein